MKHSKEYAIVCHPKAEQAVKRAVAELNGEYDIIVKVHSYMQERSVLLMCRDMLIPIEPEDNEWFGKLLQKVKDYAPKLEPYVPPKVYHWELYEEAEKKTKKRVGGKDFR